MNTYSWLKLIHIITVIISIALFFLRGVWVAGDSPRLRQRWVKVVPHVNDSFLLFSGIALTVVVAQYPFVQNWLTAKVLLLVVYIGLGMVAITQGKTKSIRIVAWLLALAVYGYIVLIALTKDPIPFGV
jgi:uncharacterized membrane protein SirB2